MQKHIGSIEIGRSDPCLLCVVCLFIGVDDLLITVPNGEFRQILSKVGFLPSEFKIFISVDSYDEKTAENYRISFSILQYNEKL